MLKITRNSKLSQLPASIFDKLLQSDVLCGISKSQTVLGDYWCREESGAETLQYGQDQVPPAPSRRLFSHGASGLVIFPV